MKTWEMITAVVNPGKGSAVSPDSILFATPQGLRMGTRKLGDNRYEVTLVVHTRVRNFQAEAGTGMAVYYRQISTVYQICG